MKEVHSRLANMMVPDSFEDAAARAIAIAKGTATMD